MIRVIIAGHAVTALADTGATFSVLSSKFVESHGLTERLEPWFMGAETADGRVVQVTRKIILPMEVSNLQVMVPFCVLEKNTDTRYECVLGTNFLKRRGMLLDVFGDQLLFWGSSAVQPRMDVEPPPVLAMFLSDMIHQQHRRHTPDRMVQQLRLLDDQPGLDISAWDYSWPKIPIEKFDVGDDNTANTVGVIRALLLDFNDIFHTEGRKLGKAKVPPFKIELVPGTTPKYKNQYRFTPRETQEVQRQIDDMLKLVVIRPSKSPRSSPLILVKKDGGTAWRLCADVRSVNDVTVADRFPLPRIDDCLQVFAGAKFFTTMDLHSGYWQVPLDEKSKAITAFQAGGGFYEYQVLCFGLKNAPSAFQRMMQQVLTGLVWNGVMVYLDDVIVASKSLQEHLNTLREVFTRFRNAGLMLKPTKCHFAKSRVDVLGYVATEEGIQADPEKVRAILDFPKPENLKGVRGFLGITGYYRRFIKDYSKKAAPLHALSKKDVDFHWDDEQEAAFRSLKEALTSAPVLAHFNSDLPVEIHPDASGYALGVVLVQRDEENRERVIAYGGRRLNAAEKNYSTTERELLAIVFTCDKYRYYLLGREVVVCTDHHSLCWLVNVQAANSRLVRWALRLQEFDLRITYKSGKTHADGDCLSRYPPTSPEPEQFRALEGEESIETQLNVRDAQASDTWIQEIMKQLPTVKSVQKVFKMVDGILYREWKSHGEKFQLLVIPKNLRLEVLGFCHDDPMSGHLGFARTWEKVKRRFFWPQCLDFTQRYVESCPQCQARNRVTTKAGGEIQSFCPEKPFDMIAMDFCGPLPRTKSGNLFILVVTDLFSKWVLVKAFPAQNAVTVARFLMFEVFLKFSLPRKILTDQGTPFLNTFTSELFNLLSVKRSTTTAYMPSTNGCCERYNQTLAHMLSEYVDAEQRTWDEAIPYVAFAYNTSRHDTTGESPFKLLFGREATLPVDVALPTVAEPFVADVQERMVDIHAKATAKIEQKQNFLYAHDTSPHIQYDNGDLVLVFNPAGKRGKATKLLSRFYGPYRVLRQTSLVNYEVEDVSGSKRRRQVFITHVRKMKPFRDRNEMYLEVAEPSQEDDGWIPFADQPLDNLPADQGNRAASPTESNSSEEDMQTADEAEGSGDEASSTVAERPSTPQPEEEEAEIPQSENGEQPRRSARANKGVPPDRLGFGRVPDNKSVKQRQGWLHMLFGLFCWFLFLSTGMAMEIEVCDCTNPRYSGIIGFGKIANCDTNQTSLSYIPIQFDLYVESGEGHNFRGYSCRIRERKKVIDESVLWWPYTTFSESHRMVSAQECWSLATTTKCGEAKMERVGKTWSYVAEPQGSGSWWSHKEFSTLNCEFEEITLEQKCASCPVMSVLGELACKRSDGHAVMAHRTVVWSETDKGPKPCEVHRLGRRSAQLYNDSGVLRLRDNEHQMDFIFGCPRKTCDPVIPRLYSVTGEPHLLIDMFNSSTGKRIPPESFVRQMSADPNAGSHASQSNFFPKKVENRRLQRAAPDPKEEKKRTYVRPTTASPTKPATTGPYEKGLALSEALPEHLEGVENTLIEQENKIVDNLNALSCRVSKQKLQSLLTLSRVSGILAARSVNLQQCQSLESFGSIGVVRQCTRTRVDFAVDTSSACGPQPKAGNWTIGYDGFSLKSYSPCFWKTSVINFRGEPYEARNGTWYHLRPTIYSNRQLLVAHFDPMVDYSGGLLAAAMEREHANTLNLLGELAGTIEQHGFKDVGTLVQQVKQTATLPNIFEKLRLVKLVAGLVLGFFLICLVLVCALKFQKPLVWLHKRIWRSRSQRASAPPPEAEQAMTQMERPPQDQVVLDSSSATYLKGTLYPSMPA